MVEIPYQQLSCGQMLERQVYDHCQDKCESFQERPVRQTSTRIIERGACGGSLVTIDIVMPSRSRPELPFRRGRKVSPVAFCSSLDHGINVKPAERWFVV